MSQTSSERFRFCPQCGASRADVGGNPLVCAGCGFKHYFGPAVAVGAIISVLYVDEPMMQSNPAYWAAHIGTGLLSVVCLELFGLYRMPTLSSAITNMPRLLLGWAVAFMLLVAAVIFMKQAGEFSRVWLAAWFGFGSVATGRPCS